MLALLAAVVTGAMAQTTYKVSVKEGTEDATSWHGKAGEGEYQTLPLEGVAAGTAVSVKYNGTKKVKSVTAVKKAAVLTYPIALSAVTVEHIGNIVTADGNVYATAADAIAASETPVAMIAYVGNDAETSPTNTKYHHGLALALEDVSDTKTWCSQKDATCLGTQYDNSTKFNDLAGIINTNHLILSAGSHTHSAATAARQFKYVSTADEGAHPAGTSAWFLPSAGLWDKMATAANGYANLKTNAGLQQGAVYWSSTEVNANQAWNFLSNNGMWWNFSKDAVSRVRACLAF